MGYFQKQENRSQCKSINLRTMISHTQQLLIHFLKSKAKVSFSSSEAMLWCWNRVLVAPSFSHKVLSLRIIALSRASLPRVWRLGAPFSGTIVFQNVLFAHRTQSERDSPHTRQRTAPFLIYNNTCWLKHFRTPWASRGRKEKLFCYLLAGKFEFSDFGGSKLLPLDISLFLL